MFANAGIHAAFFGKEKELAEKATNPICLLPTKDDPMEDVQQIMEKKDVASKCFFKRYDDQVHGFLAARGDFKDEQVAKRAGEARCTAADACGPSLLPMALSAVAPSYLLFTACLLIKHLSTDMKRLMSVKLSLNWLIVLCRRLVT